jgi:hypothetical protein
MSENIYRLTKTEIDKLNRLLREGMDHLDENGVVITEQEAENRRRSGRSNFGRFINGYDHDKITDEIRKWSGHDRIHADHVRNQRRALFGSMYKVPKEKTQSLTLGVRMVELKEQTEQRFATFEKQIKQMEFAISKLELAMNKNSPRY